MDATLPPQMQMTRFKTDTIQSKTKTSKPLFCDLTANQKQCKDKSTEQVNDQINIDLMTKNIYHDAASGMKKQSMPGEKIMNVKGSVFINLVRAVKHDKSGAFNKYLTDKDRVLLNNKILPGGWYPFETYEHCIIAIYEVLAKSNPDIAKGWGRAECREAMTGIYASFVEGQDPIRFVRDYGMVHKRFYDFGKTEVLVEGKNQVVFKLVNFDTRCVPLYYFIQGWLEQGMELCGAKNIQCAFLSKCWEGYPDTSLRITWT